MFLGVSPSVGDICFVSIIYTHPSVLIYTESLRRLLIMFMNFQADRLESHTVNDRSYGQKEALSSLPPEKLFSSHA